MSDGSDNDFGGFGPTTPGAPRQPIKSRATSQRNGGPSNTKRARNEGPIEIDSDTHQEESEAEVLVVAPQKTRVRASSAQPNGKPTKTKPKPPTKTKKKPDDDPIEIQDDNDIEMLPVDIPPSKNKAKKPVAITRPAKSIDALTRENEKLRAAQKELQNTVNTLQNQLEEYFRIRETEPEKLRQEQAQVYEEQLKEQKLLNQELSAALAKAHPLSKNSFLHMITREAAEEQKRNLETENTRLKAEAEEKDARILQLEAKKNELEVDLKAEIDHNTQLAQANRRNPQPAANKTPSRNTADILGSNNPMHAAAIAFYEEITNLLITNIRIEPSDHSLYGEDRIVTCVYTVGEISLSFKLHFLMKAAMAENESEENTSDELVPSITYEPLELDNHEPGFKDQIKYYNKPFTFLNEQLPLFVRSLYDILCGVSGEEEEEES